MQAPPAAPPLAGREPEGAPGAALQTCSGCASRLSPSRVAAGAEAEAVGGSRDLQFLWGAEEETAPFPRAQQPQPVPGARRLSLPGLAAQHEFPPGAGAPVLALPADGCRVRREVSWAPGRPLLPALISHSQFWGSTPRGVYAAREATLWPRSWATAQVLGSIVVEPLRGPARDWRGRAGFESRLLEGGFAAGRAAHPRSGLGNWDWGRREAGN